MDPTECLEIIRGLIEDINRDDYTDRYTIDLIDAIASLDHWISRGGFLPEQWRKD